MKSILLCFLFFLTASMNVYAANPLPADQAFVFSTHLNDDHELMVDWKVADGYFLYGERTHIQITSANSNDIQTSPPQKAEHLRGHVTLVLPLTEKVSGDIQVTANYQGCSDEKFCYPPITKIISISNSTTPSTLLTSQEKVQQLLHGQNTVIIFLLCIGLGLLLAFTPCVLPMIPILASIIVGQKKQVSTYQAFLLSLSYVLGMALMYAGAGALAAMLGHSLQVWVQQTWVIVIYSAVFIFLAFSLFDLVNLPMPKIFQMTIKNHPQGGTYFSVFMMGAISTLIISPCVTAPLIGVLIYISQTGKIWFGATALFAIGIGMGIPLLLISCSLIKWLPKTGVWMVMVKKLFGLLMLGMAIWLLSRVAAKPMMVEEKANFVVVHQLAEVKAELAKAKSKGMPALVDFYADWCDACIDMDKTVFASPMVQAKLKSMQFIRVDLTPNNQDDRDIMTFFDVIGPPTVILFNAKGQERVADRIVGEVDKNEFLAKITQ